MANSQNKNASLTKKSSSFKNLEKAQKNPISSRTKEIETDMDAITDVSMSEDMYNYAAQDEAETEVFSIWFKKEFDIENSPYQSLINTNIIEFLKSDYDDDREYLVKYHKDIFEDLIEIRNDALNSKFEINSKTPYLKMNNTYNSVMKTSYIGRPINEKEKDLLIGLQYLPLVFKRLDDVTFKIFESPINGWTHELIDCVVDLFMMWQENYTHDLYLGSNWIGSSEI